MHETKHSNKMQNCKTYKKQSKFNINKEKQKHKKKKTLKK